MRRLAGAWPACRPARAGLLRLALAVGLTLAPASQLSATAPPLAGPAGQPASSGKAAWSAPDPGLHPYPGEMNQAQSDYVEHCGGCHGIGGDAAPADLPTLKGRVGWFLCTPEGRSYLIRLPNVSRSRISDNDQLADLLNFMVFGLGGGSAPAGARPFTAAEVARERGSPFTSVSLIETRRLLVEKLIRQCRAPASLRLMYPGQRAAGSPAGRAARAGKAG
jgi:hypothetical protein